jgi:hypothetical protein
MARRRIGQEDLIARAEPRAASLLSELAALLLDWREIDRALVGISAAARGEPAWPLLAMFRALLVGGMAPGLPRAGLIGLQEGLPQRCRGHGLLRLADMGQRMPHPMGPAPLLCRTERASDRCLQPLTGIGDDELHAVQAAALQGAQEVQPERLRLRTADCHAEDLAPVVGVHAATMVTATGMTRPASLTFM